MSLLAVLRRVESVLEGDRRYVDLLSDVREELARLEERQTVRRVQHERRPALEGERFVWAAGPGGGEIELVVRSKSPGDGDWLCISCGVSLDHNLDKDLHCGRERKIKRQITHELGDGRARHVLAWRNFVSGFVEVP